MLKDRVQVDMNKSEHFKGYSGIMSENVDPANRGDLHEAFDTSNVLEGLWPDIPGFKEDLTAYLCVLFLACESCSGR